MKEEIWKDVVGYEGDYQVSNLGNVRSLKFGKERVLKPGKNTHGYLYVILYKDGKIKKFHVHQLVSITFLSHVPNGMSSVIDHIDSNPLNNRLENLRVVSHRENTTFGTLKRDTSSKYTGVYWNKNAKKWKAQIKINGKQKHLGYFNSELEAAEAYKNALK